MVYSCRSSILVTGSISLILLADMAFAAGDPSRGARAFQACMVCHSIKPSDHMTGPSLANIWNRKAGTVEGFSRYSEALKRADIVWNDATLNNWLTDPEKFIPGNNMAFPGTMNRQAREDIIAYLKAASESKAPTRDEQGDRSGMHRARINLRDAPPEGQVIAISYCGDTYTVSTADQKTQKVWEFNLRFKTDSSKDGPLPGKPVVIGAGMRGDRASVVFAKPGEISTFIQQTCP